MGRMGKTASKAVSVFVAEASRINCQLLESALERCRYNFDVVASSVSSTEAIAALQEHNPQLAVISANLEDGPEFGLKVLRELRATRPETRSILLVDKADRALVIEAFRSGARGVFSRSEDVKELCKCLNKVHEGQVWMTGQDLNFILEALEQAAPMRVVNTKGMPLLTKREDQVVQLVAEGMKNSEISTQLGLSIHTVKNYLLRIFEKLGISSRVELILYAVHQKEANRTRERQGTG